jgi:gamma-glutamylcyclotransferase (GGCT)/AIG2-like uncharacterized protein YtfP
MLCGFGSKQQIQNFDGGDRMTETGLGNATKMFVYGSMSDGMVHFQKIRNFIVDQEKASVQGKAYRLKAGFPVLMEQGESHVPGFLITIKSSDLLTQLLDQFHGVSDDPKKALHFKKQVEVWSAGGQKQKAWVYFLNPAKLPATAVLIEDGDWIRDMAENQTLISQLTERQIAYIKRLGQSVGREIIPIDLPLYRELMNLEMVVDKGRRLALSKTGNEVFRYLE